MMKRSDIELPPGFRFHPTDEELVNHYLCRKCAGLPISVPVIAEIDLYRFDPWQLPEMTLYGEKEWYFFSPRDRKYPNGSRPNRSAGTGYWKATGADKPIGKPKTLGIKKALVFYVGKAPKGMKTNWIMHEYRLANVDRSPAKKNNRLRLDDWVLCRLYNKKGRMEKHYPTEQTSMNFPEMKEEQKPDIMMTLPPQLQPSMINGLFHMDTSESIPQLQTDSSSLEHMLSPEITKFDKEVQSEAKWNVELENGFNEFELNYLDDLNSTFQIQDDPFAPQIDYQLGQLSPLQDISMILQQKPYSF